MAHAKLHPYQAYCKEHILSHPFTGLLLDMGLGKTLTTLSAIKELVLDYGVVNKVLVIAPLSVTTVWADEVAKWDNFSELTLSLVTGSAANRKAALFTDVDIYIINVDNVAWLVEYYGRAWPFDMIVIDELSTFKSASTRRFKALRKVRPKASWLVGLTGTPSPNGLQDLWSQIYLLDRGERLGTSMTRYRQTYFYPLSGQGYVVYKWGLKEGAEDKIHDKISDICVSMKAKDYLKLPGRVDNVIEVQLPQEALRTYHTLKRQFVAELAGETVTASNAAVLSNKLLQMASGKVYYNEDHDEVTLHTAKLEALERVVEEAQGQPILVFYTFKHERDRLLKHFKQAKQLDVKAGDVKRWNAGEIPMLLANPQSAGHGLNLQQGGHIIVWYNLTWSLEQYLQANARLDRQGQTQPVIVHHLVAKGTIDEQVMEALKYKNSSQEALMTAVKAAIEEG
ncbi:DEAD/DEAH box helicase family protein [Enterococcus cecorum]|uniref:DEAD/DEAH box helicase n=1 Tax=Enterococcus cecorum TaxID=44008 RepID=UPI0024934EFC|nr:DEAD/DEAH box helicase [Enterococcus cecorum]CAI3519889.1 DEAD/DEAH box helicase family protein [Enterococcus cecorum]